MDKYFFSTAQAAKQAGLSRRHFTRILDQLGAHPVIIGRKHFYTAAHIKQVKHRKAAA